MIKRNTFKNFNGNLAGPGRQPGYFLFKAKKKVSKEMASKSAVALPCVARAAGLCRPRNDPVPAALRWHGCWVFNPAGKQQDSATHTTLSLQIQGWLRLFAVAVKSHVTPPERSGRRAIKAEKLSEGA